MHTKNDKTTSFLVQGCGGGNGRFEKLQLNEEFLFAKLQICYLKIACCLFLKDVLKVTSLSAQLFF